MIKKLITGLIVCGGICSPFISQAEVEITTPQEENIHILEEYIAEGKATQKDLIKTLQTIHLNDKKRVADLIDAGKMNEAQKVINNREDLYEITTYFYTKEMGSGVVVTTAKGEIFQFNKFSPMNWIHMMVGDEGYFVFPHKDQFIELQGNVITGDEVITNELALIQKGEKNFPQYIYEEPIMLYENENYKEQEPIFTMDNTGNNLYYYFDVNTGNTTLQTIGGTTVDLKEVYEWKSYSPFYNIRDNDYGFKYCQEVAKLAKSTDTTPKKYSIQECRDAAAGIFYPEMEYDIIRYAVKQEQEG